MRTAVGLLCIVCLSLLMTTGCPSGQPSGPVPTPPEPASRPAMADRQLSGPFTYRNLAVFLVHGKTDEPAGELLTLDEAVAAKKLIVHETGEVNELAVENVDPQASVYIQAGYIVKGGRQDRILANDLVVPPRSGKVQIASFCVESGRWTGRVGESSVKFEAASKLAAGNELKYAAKQAGNQSEVWRNVARDQTALSSNVGTVIAGDRSPSSLQLALEHPELEKRVKEYTDELAGVTKDKADIVGMVFAVNGDVRSADIYASRKLFAKLWPKLLESAATEAFRDWKKDQPVAAVKTDTVNAWLAKADEGRSATRQLPNGVQVISVENNDVVRFDTNVIYSAGNVNWGAAPSPALLHQNIIERPEIYLVGPEPTPQNAPNAQQTLDLDDTILMPVEPQQPAPPQPSTRPGD